MKGITAHTQISLTARFLVAFFVFWALLVKATDHGDSEDGTAQMYQAVAEGQLQVVEELLARGVSPYQLDKHKHNALMLSAIFGHKMLYDYFMTYGIDPNQEDYDGDNVLCLALKSDQEDIAMDLLKYGVNPLTGCKAQGVKVKIARVYTLCVAVTYLMERWLKAALPHYRDKGLDINNCISSKRKDVEIDHPIVTLLFNQPPEEAEEARMISILKVLLKYGVSIDSPDSEGTTALTYAAARGHTKLLQFLAKHGAHINRANIRGITPLYMASNHCYAKAASYLLSKKADPNKPAAGYQTPMCVAAQEGCLEVVKLLAKKGVEIDQLCLKSMINPLFLAASNGRPDIVRFLLQQGASPLLTSQNGDYVNSLLPACDHGYAEILGMLLDASPEAELNDSLLIWGRTMLQQTILHGHLAAMETLLQHNASPMATGFDVHHGYLQKQLLTLNALTPLCEAIVLYTGNSNFVSTLLKYGASPDHCYSEEDVEHAHGLEYNVDWFCPLVFATSLNAPDLVALLLRSDSGLPSRHRQLQLQRALCIATKQRLSELKELLNEYLSTISNIYCNQAADHYNAIQDLYLKNTDTRAAIREKAQSSDSLEVFLKQNSDDLTSPKIFELPRIMLQSKQGRGLSIPKPPTGI